MKYFFYRLLPPRATFPADATEEELAIMRKHVAYWTEHMQQGRVIAFGPVADARGSYGVGIITLRDDEEPQPLGENDPAIRSGAGFRFEFHPMPRVMYRDEERS